MAGAVAVELVHNFSLVHDDVQDRDAVRHGRPTVWARMGEAQAINTGDFLITRAFEALLEAPGPIERRMAALRVLNGAMARMIAGQWADVSFETRDDVSAEEYLAMVRGKTGALLGAPLEVGALLAGAPSEEAGALGQWGETVGLAFQVRDDLLGIWGDANLTGKSTSGDISRKKKTLPIVHGLSSAAASDIQAAYSAPDVDAEDVARVVAALERAGSREACQAHAATLTRQADSLLDSFELPDSARQELRAVGRYLIERDR
jgi:geranylgeranyl diphosphate synthase type I